MLTHKNAKKSTSFIPKTPQRHSRPRPFTAARARFWVKIVIFQDFSENNIKKHETTNFVQNTLWKPYDIGERTLNVHRIIFKTPIFRRLRRAKDIIRYIRTFFFGSAFHGPWDLIDHIFGLRWSLTKFLDIFGIYRNRAFS